MATASLRIGSFIGVRVNNSRAAKAHARHDVILRSLVIAQP